MPADGGYTFADVCARVVDLALERHAGRARAPPDAPPTCRDERVDEPGAAPRRYRTAAGHARAAGRASAGPRPA